MESLENDYEDEVEEKEISIPLKNRNIRKEKYTKQIL